MGEHISDEHMALLERALDNIENDYKPTCESMSYGNGCPGPTTDSIDFWRRAVDSVPSMLAEIRSHRAAALTAEDLVTLNDAHAFFVIAHDQAEKAGSTKGVETANRIMALIDKLIVGGAS